MTVNKVMSEQEAIQQMITVAEFNAGYHYSSEAEADAIGEESLRECVSYHGQQAKIWDGLAKKLKAFQV